MKKYSIVPEILESKGITFLDEKDVKVIICKPAKERYVNPFKEPFIVIDTFARKRNVKNTRVIAIDELTRLGFEIAKILLKGNKRGYKSFRGQQIQYFIQSMKSRQMMARTITFIPSGHWVEFCEERNIVRLRGKNAGYDSRSGPKGRWVSLNGKGDETTKRVLPSWGSLR